MRRLLSSFFLFLLGSFACIICSADAPLRRPISVSQPAWLVHIDNWNYADPEKIIALIPEDIKPYVIFNISLSISHNETTGAFDRVPDGYSTARSWVQACAEHGVWCMVQCASGGYSHFPEDDLRFYEELYRNYPNFVGWNYAEQFWGFDNKFSCTFDERLAHFADLMRLGRRYGGYLCISFCGNIWSQALSPLAMMKRSSDFAQQARQAPQNLIVCDKYTQSSMFYNYESTNFGTYVAGYTSNYGIRFDQCGWSGELESEKDVMPEAAGIAPVLSNWLLTGGTVNDGPELIWQQDFRTDRDKSLGDGYTTRAFSRFPQFDNISIDLYRKILDGTVRIPLYEEVLERHKVVLIDDVDRGNDNLVYNVPETLYDGLYNMDDTKHMRDEKTWFKKTGRYPTIPAVPNLEGLAAATIPVQVKRSAYNRRWRSIAQKKRELDKLYPEEYTGTAFAARVENRWLVYNPFKNGRTAWADIPLQYNTCSTIGCRLSPYSVNLMKETADAIDIYLNNYRTDDKSLRNDTIQLAGATSEPTVTMSDRASHTPSVILKQVYSDSVLTLVIAHNGPLDLHIGCHGTATARRQSPSDRLLSVPTAPPAYSGPVTHQCEDFDFRATVGYKTAPQAQKTIGGFHGLGYHEFGTSSQAMLRDTFTLAHDGTYRVTLRYSAPTGRPRLRVYIGGSPVVAALPQTKAGEWAEYTFKGRSMKAGANQIRIASYGNAHNVYLDEVTVMPEDYKPAPSVGANTCRLNFALTEGETATDSIIVNAQGLTGALTLNTGDGFTLSLDSNGLFTPSLTLQPDADGCVADTTVYVRATADNGAGSFTRELNITADGCEAWTTLLTLSASQRLGIRSIEQPTANSTTVYNTVGQRVSQMKPGHIYIKGRRKFVAR